LQGDNREVIEVAEEYLGKSRYPTIRNISCRFVQGVLFLRGRVPSYYDKQLAQEAVARVGGVIQVVNDIEVVD
jgi:osmotically-inducible protein OsmY